MNLAATTTNHSSNGHAPAADATEGAVPPDGEPQFGAVSSAGDDGPDPNMPYFQEQMADRMPPPHIDYKDGETLSPDATLECAALLLQQIFMSPALRLEYYNRSRSWHNNSAGTGLDGGDFERQWLAMLANQLPNGKGANLVANDFGNIHRAMFLTLRRAILAITGHDVHPNPDEMPQGATVARSFHWIPNDTSAPIGTYSNSDLGLPLDRP